MRLRRLAALVLLVVLSTLGAGGAVAAAGPAAPTGWRAAQFTPAAAPTVLTGTLGGAEYRIEVPDPWNGTLVLYSHGYVVPGQPNPARSVSDPLTGGYLLGQGYALAGSSYSRTGYAIEQALQDQMALLDFFATQVGEPKRTIAWGDSLGGITTAGLIQRHPERFDGALPMCGVLGGSVGTWNRSLDTAFVFKTLLAPDAPLQVARISDPAGNGQQARQVLDAAQATPEGRARLALAFAVGNYAGWFDPASPEPAPDDYAARQRNQFLWAQQVNFPYAFSLRAELEARAGGNPSWNTGVDYREQLTLSAQRELVEALYRQAGLQLEDDLAILERAPRITNDPGATDYLIENIIFNGRIRVPVLTLHTTDDGLVPVQHEQAYVDVVGAAGNGALLRQLYVRRAGHCTMTPAERITAFQALVQRLDTGRWGDLDERTLNAAAVALGADLNVRSSGNTVVPFAPAFAPFRPSPLLRPFDVRSSLPGMPRSGGGGAEAGTAAPLAGLGIVVMAGLAAGLRRRRRAA